MKKLLPVLIGLLIMHGSCTKDKSCNFPVGNTPNLPVENPTNLYLIVSNQSSSITNIDMRVSIDGFEYINEDFQYDALTGGHNWKEFGIELTPGTHTIKAETCAGNAIFEEVIDLDEEDHWILLDYYNPPSNSSPLNNFFFMLSDKEIQLM